MKRRQRTTFTEHSSAPAPPRKDQPSVYFQAGLDLLRAGQLAEAEQCGKSALALDAGHADSLHLMGMLCMLSNRHDLAIEWFAQAIRQDQTVPDYFFNLANALEQQGCVDEAIKSLDRGLVLRPNSAGAWYNLGRLLQQQKRLDEALMCFEEARRCDPDHIEATIASALLCFETERDDEAIERLERWLEIKPGDAGALHLKAVCLSRLKRLAEALPICEQALALAPDDAEIVANLGAILLKLGRSEEAHSCLDRALALNLDAPYALNHLGLAKQELHRFAEALASFDKAVAIDPEFAEAHWNAALLRLLLGDFSRGWAGREWRRKCPTLSFVDRQFQNPQWRGELPLVGKTILLHSDEGLGDTIQFSRYATLVAREGACVILEVQDTLHPLLSTIDGVSLCLPKTGVTLPDFDLHCPLSCLPLAFAARLETIPSAIPYVSAPPPTRVANWEARLGAHDRLRVGLVWSGNPAHVNDRNRSMPFRTLCGILAADACFVSLQKDPRPDDAAYLSERGDIVDFSEHLTDFVETAALISCLDVVITVDTSVAHLAGALGCPTWILLPHTPDYRWLLDRDDSPWYPSVKLFRQDERRDYAIVLERVRKELQAKIASGPEGRLGAARIPQRC
jgi:tetratricopeptide (TPR) repeat protein